MAQGVGVGMRARVGARVGRCRWAKMDGSERFALTCPEPTIANEPHDGTEDHQQYSRSHGEGEEQALRHKG